MAGSEEVRLWGAGLILLLTMVLAGLVGVDTARRTSGHPVGGDGVVALP